MRYPKLTFGDSISKYSFTSSPTSILLLYIQDFLSTSLSVVVTGFFVHPMRRWVGMIYLFSVCVHTGFHSVLFCLTTKICRWTNHCNWSQGNNSFFGNVHVELICEHCLRLDGGWHNFFTKGRHNKTTKLSYFHFSVLVNVTVVTYIT